MFHHTKIVQRDRPKPHLRLRVRPRTMYGEPDPHRRLSWSVERIDAATVLTYREHQPESVVERTQWWPTSRLALDAAFYQFSCEWPAGR